VCKDGAGSRKCPRIGFLDYLAQIHYSYAIGYVFNHGEVVGDEQIRKAELLLKLPEEIQYLRLYRNVESRYGFIANDELGLQRQRSGDCLCAAAAHPRIRAGNGSRARRSGLQGLEARRLADARGDAPA